MDEYLIDIVKASYQTLAFRADDLGEQFFARLFRRDPALRTLFPRDAWQRDHDLASGLGVLLRNLHRVDAISPMLEDAGARCQVAGVQPHQFGVARDALLETLRDMTGPGWNEDLEAGWTEVLNTAVSMMIRGGGRARLRAA